MMSTPQWLQTFWEKGMPIRGATIDIGTVDQGAAGAAAWPVTLSDGSACTAAITNATDSTGSPVTAGKVSVTFVFSSDFAGTVLGTTVTPTRTPSIGFDAPNGRTLPACAYTCTAGTVTIITLT